MKPTKNRDSVIGSEESTGSENITNTKCVTGVFLPDMEIPPPRWIVPVSPYKQ